MTAKTASGIIVYLQEELGDARLRAQQLTAHIKAAIDLVEKSSHRDHFFEVAGHLIHGIPDTAFKLGKALDAAALAAAKLDYEEIKQGLKPEKVEELEQALDDVRLRYLNRRSNEESMNPKTTADALNQLAAEIDATGHVPVAKLARLIGALERGQKTASNQPKRAAAAFRAAATHLTTSKAAVSRTKLAQSLRKILAESEMNPPVAGAGEEFQKQNPKITDEEVAKINEEHEKNKDVVKDKAKEAAVESGPLMAFQTAFGTAKAALMAASKGNERLACLQGLGTIQNMTAALAGLAPEHADALNGIGQKAMRLLPVIKAEAVKTDALTATVSEDKEARHEKGKSVDPTKDMSPEDAAKWKQMNDEHKDVVKDMHK